jgi:DnaJ-class molecular chaperone
MYDGERIVFSREADESPDMAAGDLIVILKELSHDIFTRNGDDLKMKHFLTLKEALLGFETEIKHLDGTLKLERNQITQNGFIMDLKGKGMPKDLFADTYGDLFIEFSVVLPVSLTQAQKTALEIL